VAAELALTFVVLTLAGLLAKSAWKVERTPAGFDPANLVAADLDLRSRPAAEGLRFFERLREELLRTDGVTAAALGQQLPLGAIRATDTFSVASVDLSLASRYDVVSPGYFATLGIAILDGRDFRDSDRADSAPVAILNEELARRIGGGAIGRTIRSGRDGIAARVIGVVHDSKYNDITEPPQPFVYFPMAQKFRQEMHVFVRTRQQDALPTLRGAVRRLDPGVAVAEFQTMTEQAARARAVPRVSALASSSAAAAALFLAVVGLYGMVMTAVQLRAREIAIRAALGSRPSQTITRLVREVAISTVAGLSVGGVVAVPAGRLLAAMLFEVSPADPIVLTVVAAALSLAAACACIVPARRALALDPAALLRN
jgi:predicted permease